MHDNHFERMEAVMAAGRAGNCAQLEEALADRDWRIRFTAAVAAGECGDEGLALPLVALIDREDLQPLYSEPRMSAVSSDAASIFGSDLEFDGQVTDEEKAAWQRRGRVKQAAILALGELGIRRPEVLSRLHRDLLDMKQDYMVRAACAKALGELGDRGSLSFLQQACEDDEFCTRTEACKAVAQIERMSGNE